MAFMPPDSLELSCRAESAGPAPLNVTCRLGWGAGVGGEGLLLGQSHVLRKKVLLHLLKLLLSLRGGDYWSSKPFLEKNLIQPPTFIVLGEIGGSV